MIKNIEIAEEKITEPTHDNICPDYDDECVFVEDKLSCFIGGCKQCVNGDIIYTPPCKGYCPFIHQPN